MSARTRRSLQVAVVTLGVLFFAGNLIDGVGVWDLLPLIAMTCGLFAIEQVRRNQERGHLEAAGTARAIVLVGVAACSVLLVGLIVHALTAQGSAVGRSVGMAVLVVPVLVVLLYALSVDRARRRRYEAQSPADSDGAKS